MSLFKADIRWGVAIGGTVAVLGFGLMVWFGDGFSSGVSALLWLGIAAGLILLCWFENYLGGLLMGIALSLVETYQGGVEQFGIYQLPYVLLLGIVIIGWYRQSKADRIWYQGPIRAHWPLLIYLGWSLGSCVFQRWHNSAGGMVIGEILVSYGILVWMYLHRTKKNTLQDWMLAYCIGLGLVLTYSFLFSPYPGKGAPQPFYFNANYLSAALSIGLPFLVWIAWSRKGAWRMVGIAGAAYLLFGIVWFQSRGAWVGLGGGMAAFVLVAGKNWKQKAAFGGVMALAITTLVLWSQTPDRLDSEPDSHFDALMSISDTEHNFSNQERLLRWKLAWRLSLKDPLLGVQPGRYEGRFKYALEDMLEVESISYWYGWMGGAHSEYMTRLAERGWPGVLAFIGYFGFVFYALYRSVKQNWLDRRWAGAIAFALGTWVVHGVFNDLTTANSIWIALLVITGYVLLITSRGKAAKA